MRPLSRRERAALNKLIRHAQTVLAFADGEAVASVAKRFGYTQTTVTRICRSRSRLVRSNLTPESRLKGNRPAAAAIKRKADEAYRDLYLLVTKLRTEGLTFQAIANHLDELGIKTRTGKRWNKTQVLLVLRRAERLTS
jgi:hypothetical protein